MMRSTGHCSAGRAKAKMKSLESFCRLDGAGAPCNLEDRLACHGTECSHQELTGASKGA